MISGPGVWFPTNFDEYLDLKSPESVSKYLYTSLAISFYRGKRNQSAYFLIFNKCYGYEELFQQCSITSDQISEIVKVVKNQIKSGHKFVGFITANVGKNPYSNNEVFQTQCFFKKKQVQLTYHCSLMETLRYLASHGMGELSPQFNTLIESSLYETFIDEVSYASKTKHMPLIKLIG